MKTTPAILSADRFFRIFLSGALTTLYYPMDMKWNVLLNIICIAANIFCITQLVTVYRVSGEDIREWRNSFRLGYIWHGVLMAIHIFMLVQTLPFIEAIQI